MLATSLDLPCNQQDAIARIADALKEAARENESAEFSDEKAVELNTPLACHWHFTACRDLADREGWPLKRQGEAPSWTSGDRIQTFLGYFDLPRI